MYPAFNGMKSSALKTKLDKLYRTYNREFVYSDPITFVHRYEDPADKEVVGLMCASLAYGHVKMIQRNLERLLDLLGPHPKLFITRFDPLRARSVFSGFAHRFTVADDIVLLLYYMKQMLAVSGSIGDFFESGYCATDTDIERSLQSFVERALALDCSPIYPGSLPKDAGVRFFFPSPSGRSACKRLNLYLRWMVRRAGGIDFGLWRFISPAQLIMPLDTHIARICSLIGLTARRSPGWPMAAEITQNLRKLDPLDPVKYDFALSRLGILAQCPKKSSFENCSNCELRRLCGGFRRPNGAGHSKGKRTRNGCFAQVHR